MQDQTNPLIGTWKSDPDDSVGYRTYGNVTLKFGTDGNLLYISHGQEKDEIIRLTYDLQDSYLITNQPSHPRPETTQYELTQDGKLILAFGDQKSRYIRAI